MKSRRMPSLMFLIIFPLLLCSQIPIRSDSADPLYKVISTLKGYSSFMLRFDQETFNLTSGQTITARGRVAFTMPDKFRWDYFSSPCNIVASDGKILMLLLPDDRQAMIEPASKEDLIWSPLSILLNPDQINTNYAIIEQIAENSSRYQFKLTPKTANKQFEYILVAFDKLPGDFQFDLTLFDSTGNKNVLKFSALTSSPALYDFLPEIPSDYEKTDFSGNHVKTADSLIDGEAKE